MPSPLQTVLDVILGITPVPGLSAAFNILSLIVSAIEQARKSKQRLAVLAQSAAQLLQTLNTEFTAARLVQSACGKPLRDLHRWVSVGPEFIYCWCTIEIVLLQLAPRHSEVRE
jgi:hypothetical protein